MDCKLLLSFASASLGLALTGAIAQAQVTADGTANTTVVQSGTDFSITQGTATGSNLFHSFQHFSVPTGSSATFNLVNTPSITRIFSRVTGGSMSTIDGLIQTRNSTNPVSLFLINPAGILFGPNARLNISGSFQASTASSFQFADGSEFSATNPQAPPVLTVNVPLGLQTGSIPTGSTITNRGNLTAGQDLILEANTLDLQGQLVASRDLTLRAENTVQIRDTVTAPFVGRSSGKLTIQGNQGIDILALNHPEAALQSGGNLTLISNGNISADAHFLSGGGLSFQTLAETPGKFISLFDPIIYANGDVVFGDYTGVALKVEATGSIEGGNIRITGPDIAIPASDPDFVTLTTQPAVILRAGVAAVPVPNTPQSEGGTSFTSGTAAIGYPAGSIVVSTIDTSDSNGGDGGSITLTAKGDITTTGSFPSAFGLPIALGTFSSSFTGDSGTGGAIALTSTSGNISVNGLDAGSLSFAGNSSNGGAIAITSSNGNISINNLNAYSLSFVGNSGDGGAIAVSSSNGNISIDNLFASSFGLGGNSGDGGAIALSATNGNLAIDSLLSASNANGSSGNGGKVSLAATNGDITSSSSGVWAVESLAYDMSGNGGTINAAATNGNITSSTISTVSGSFGSSGDGGAISLSTTNGSLTSNGELSSLSFSPTGNSGNGGAITLSSTNGNILSNSNVNSVSLAQAGNSGNGGAIGLTATNGDIIGTGSNISSFSVADSGRAGSGGAVSLNAKNQVSGLSILTASSTSSSGAVSIVGQSDLTIADTTLLTSKQVEVYTPFGPISVQVDGTGRSGNVNVSSTGNLTLINSRIESDTKGTDPAGNVNLISPGLIRFDNSQIVSSTTNSGQAGNITLTAGQGIDLGNQSNLAALTTNTGKAGDITLTAPTVTVSGNAEISAATQGSGRGGTITVNAPTAVNLLRQQGTSPVLSVEASGAGKAGDIVINTANLTLADQARITATATATASTTEGGGSITLNASQMNLAGVVGVFAETQGQAPAGTLRLNPYANDSTLAINLTPQSQISASTTGSGNGGDLILTAPQAITLSGAGKLAVETSSSGNAGNVLVSTRQLTLNNGVELSASSSGSGKAGNLTIAANTVSLSQGARVSSNASGSGAAGDISLKVGDQLTLKDAGTGLFATTTASSTGKGGSITLTASTTRLQDRAAIAVGSLGQGAGGNITVQSQQLSLENQSSLTAETASTQGGNITLEVPNLLLLRRNSLISTTAGTAQAGGNGGSITIQNANGFIVGVLQENSDIRANAFTGNGGNVNITTQGIFGLQFQPKNTPNSDITASSEFGLNGTVQITLLSIDPARKLDILPLELVDPSGQIVSACAASNKNQFVVTGRGGVPQNPTQRSNTNRLWADLRDLSTYRNSTRIQAQVAAAQRPIVEASTLARINGQVELVTANSPAPLPQTATCARGSTRVD